MFPTSPPPARYTPVARLLHWLVFLVILCAVALILLRDEIPRDSIWRLRLLNGHKWMGVTVLALSVLRLLWRSTHRPPPLPPLPVWERYGAHAAHGALYLLMFAVPLMGWYYSSAAGFPIVWFGILPLPDLTQALPERNMARIYGKIHELLSWVFLSVIALHVVAALKHQWIDKNGLLRRMW